MYSSLGKLLAIIALPGMISQGLSGLMLIEPAGWSLALCGFVFSAFIARQRVNGLTSSI